MSIKAKIKPRGRQINSQLIIPTQPGKVITISKRIALVTDWLDKHNTLEKTDYKSVGELSDIDLKSIANNIYKYAIRQHSIYIKLSKYPESNNNIDIYIRKECFIFT